MDNGQIFNLLNIIIRKEKEGDTISPFDFSELLQMCSLEKGNADYSYFEQNQIITDSLRTLKDNVPIGLVGGVGDFISLTTDYWHVTGITHSGGIIELLTDLQYDEYEYSDLLQPTIDFAVAKILGDDINVLPISIPTVNFGYLKKPATPFYDYYINTNDEYIYMPVGSDHTLLAGEEYRDGTTSGIVNSISVEMSYPDNERVQVFYLMLEKIGIVLNKQDAIQYGLNKEQKEEIQ